MVSFADGLCHSLADKPHCLRLFGDTGQIQFNDLPANNIQSFKFRVLHRKRFVYRHQPTSAWPCLARMPSLAISRKNYPGILADHLRLVNVAEGPIADLSDNGYG